MLKNFFLVLISIIISLFFIECALRLMDDSWYNVYPRFEDVKSSDGSGNVFADIFLGPGIVETQDARPYALKKNMTARFLSAEYDTTVTTNEFGLRGRTPELNVAEKVLILGDSFVMGYGVEDNETFAAVLNEELGDAIEVINGGVFGYNPYSSYEYLIKEGIRFNPKTVVLCLWAGDDIYGYSGPQRALTKADSSFGEIVRGYVAGSYFVRLVLNVMKSNDSVRKLFFDFGILARVSTDLVVSKDKPLPMHDNLKRQGGVLKSFQSFCNKRGIQFVVVLIPCREQIDRRYFDYARLYNLRDDDFEVDVDGPSHDVKGLTDALAIEFIDLEPVIREAHGKQGCYFPIYDPHFNAFGHRVVSDKLQQVLFNSF